MNSSPLPARIRAAAVGVGEMGVTAVDEQVAGVQERENFLDDGVHRLPGRHHGKDGPGLAQQPDEFFQLIAGPDIPGARFLGHEFPGLLGGAVVDGHAESRGRRNSRPDSGPWSPGRLHRSHIRAWAYEISSEQ